MGSAQFPRPVICTLMEEVGGCGIHNPTLPKSISAFIIKEKFGRYKVCFYIIVLFSDIPSSAYQSQLQAAIFKYCRPIS